MKEQIDLSDPTVENSEAPEAVETPPAIENSKIITYRHASGLEVSGTVEQMRNGCPVLAKMAVEECVELIAQQDIAIMLAERGKARRIAAKKLAEEQTAEPEKDLTVAPIIILETAVQTPTHSETAGYVVVLDKPEVQVKHSELVQPVSKDTVSAPPNITATKRAVPKPAKIATHPVEKEKVITEKVPDSIVEKPAKVEVVVPFKKETKQETVVAQAQEILVSNIENEESLDQAIEEIELVEKSEEIVDFTVEAEEVYQQIVDLISVETSAVDVEEEPTMDDIATAPEVMVFEELIESLTAEEEPIELSEIIEASEERPLEITFAYIAAFLEQIPEINDTSSEIAPISEAEIRIREILSDIGIELQRIITTEKENTPLPITPELVKSLLALLRELGYEKPQEILLMFLKPYSIEFLLYTLRSLYQAANEDNQQTQLLQKSMIDPYVEEEPISVRLGKLIVAMFRIKSEPSDLLSID